MGWMQSLKIAKETPGKDGTMARDEIDKVMREWWERNHYTRIRGPSKALLFKACFSLQSLFLAFTSIWNQSMARFSNKYDSGRYANRVLNKCKKSSKNIIYLHLYWLELKQNQSCYFDTFVRESVLVSYWFLNCTKMLPWSSWDRKMAAK